MSGISLGNQSDDDLTNLSWLHGVSVLPNTYNNDNTSSKTSTSTNNSSNKSRKRKSTSTTATAATPTTKSKTPPPATMCLLMATSQAPPIDMAPLSPPPGPPPNKHDSSSPPPLTVNPPQGSPVKKLQVHQKTNADKLAEKHRELSALGSYRSDETAKPPFSYAALICLAMRESGLKRMTLSQIYQWIRQNFAYYRGTDISWQNSIRHNLSLNRCFEKLAREKGDKGKGGFWTLSKSCRGEDQDFGEDDEDEDQSQEASKKSRTKKRKRKKSAPTTVEEQKQNATPNIPDIKIKVEEETSKISYNFEADKATTTSVILGIQSQLSQIQQSLQNKSHSLPPFVRLAQPQQQLQPITPPPPPQPAPPMVYVTDVVQASLASAVPLPAAAAAATHEAAAAIGAGLNFSDVLSIMQQQEARLNAKNVAQVPQPQPPPPPPVTTTISPASSPYYHEAAAAALAVASLPPSPAPMRLAVPVAPPCANSVPSPSLTPSPIPPPPAPVAPMSDIVAAALAATVEDPASPNLLVPPSSSSSCNIPPTSPSSASDLVMTSTTSSPPPPSTSSSRLTSNTFDSEDFLSLDLPLYNTNTNNGDNVCTNADVDSSSSPSVVLKNFSWMMPYNSSSPASSSSALPLPSLDDATLDLEMLMDIEKLPS